MEKGVESRKYALGAALGSPSFPFQFKRRYGEMKEYILETKEESEWEEHLNKLRHDYVIEVLSMSAHVRVRREGRGDLFVTMLITKERTNERILPRG